jgi:RimJ/RimL family protein N-acetyltransferase
MIALSMRPLSEVDPSIIIGVHGLPHVVNLLNTPSVDEVERRSKQESSRDFVAFDSEGRVAGLLLMDRIHSWLYEVSRILSVREREGIGTSILRWALRHIFEENGAHRAFLEVHERNVGARRLYESVGFLQEGTYRDGFRNPVDGTFENLCPYGLLDVDYMDLVERLRPLI